MTDAFAVFGTATARSAASTKKNKKKNNCIFLLVQNKNCVHQKQAPGLSRHCNRLARPHRQIVRAGPPTHQQQRVCIVRLWWCARLRLRTAGRGALSPSVLRSQRNNNTTAATTTKAAREQIKRNGASLLSGRPGQAGRAGRPGPLPLRVYAEQAVLGPRRGRNRRRLQRAPAARSSWRTGAPPGAATN